MNWYKKSQNFNDEFEEFDEIDEYGYMIDENTKKHVNNLSNYIFLLNRIFKEQAPQYGLLLKEITTIMENSIKVIITSADETFSYRVDMKVENNRIDTILREINEKNLYGTEGVKTGIYENINIYNNTNILKMVNDILSEIVKMYSYSYRNNK